MCSSSIISSSYSVFNAFRSLDWFLDGMLANRGVRILKCFQQHSKQSGHGLSKNKKQIHCKLQFQQLQNNDIQRNKIRAKGFSTKTVLIWHRNRRISEAGGQEQQDNSLKSTSLPSSTMIHTAGPDNLATQTGLLYLLVNDDEGNTHQLMLENAPVVPGLSHTLHLTNNL